MTTITAALLLAAAFQGPAAPDEKKVREILEKLDSDEVAVRAQAEEDLLAQGERIVPLLEKARAGATGEAKAKIDSVIATLTLAPRWAKELTDEATSNEAYQRLEQALRAKTLERKQAARILTLALQTEKASDTARQMVFSAAERHRFTEVWPALLQLAVRDDQENSAAAGSLQRLRPGPEAADEILKALPKVKSRPTALQLLQLAVSLKPDKTKLDLAIRAMLEGDLDDNGRSQLLSQISTGRYPITLRTAWSVWKNNRQFRQTYGTYVRESLLRAEPDDTVREVLQALTSPEGDDVLLVADYAGRHKLAEAAAPLVEALHRLSSEDRTRDLQIGPLRYSSYGALYANDERQLRLRVSQVLRGLEAESRIRGWLGGAQGAPPVAALLTAVGELEMKSLGGEVAAMLAGGDPAIRREAARVLGTLKHAEALPALEGRLKDENLPVRRAALHAIVRIRGALATPFVLAELRSDNPDVQAAACEVLPSMDADAVIEELTKDEALAKPSMRYALAVFLSRGGEASLHRVMARVAGKIKPEEMEASIRLVQTARLGR